MLDRHRVLYQLLGARERSGNTPSEEASLRDGTKAAIERLWRTGEIRLEKPTLTDECRNVLHYLRDVFPAVLPGLDDRLCHAYAAAGFDPALVGHPGCLPRVRFGTCVGGDRDGHVRCAAACAIVSAVAATTAGEQDYAVVPKGSGRLPDRKTRTELQTNDVEIRSGAAS